MLPEAQLVYLLFEGALLYSYTFGSSTFIRKNMMEIEKCEKKNDPFKSN